MTYDQLHAKLDRIARAEIVRASDVGGDDDLRAFGDIGLARRLGDDRWALTDKGRHFQAMNKRRAA
jgi:hypothetical protein